MLFLQERFLEKSEYFRPLINLMCVYVLDRCSEKFSWNFNGFDTNTVFYYLPKGPLARKLLYLYASCHLLYKHSTPNED